MYFKYHTLASRSNDAPGHSDDMTCIHRNSHIELASAHRNEHFFAALHFYIRLLYYYGNDDGNVSARKYARGMFAYTRQYQ